MTLYMYSGVIKIVNFLRIYFFRKFTETVAEKITKLRQKYKGSDKRIKAGKGRLIFYSLIDLLLKLSDLWKKYSTELAGSHIKK